MTQQIKFSDNIKNPILIPDGEIDTTTNIGLIGKNVKGFGEQLNENFLHLLENFASDAPPTRPIEGMLWFNNNTNMLMQYTTTGTWKPVTGVKTESTDPVTGIGETPGDIWINTNTLQLFIYVNSSWIPLISADATTRWEVKSRRDTLGIMHKTIEGVVGNKTVAILSGDTVPWIPNSTGATTEYLADNSIMVSSYTNIKLGLNLINRKNIPEITVSNNTPAISAYTQIGDLWVNPNVKNIFVYTAQGWRRISSAIRIENSAPLPTTSGEIGDFWIDLVENQLYYYNTITGEWTGVLSNTIFSEESPTSANVVSVGNYWVNTQTRQLYAYSGSAWINLSPTTDSTGIRVNHRLDTDSIIHEVLECYVDNKLTMVIASDETSWIPAVTEMVGNIQFDSIFSEIYPGINVVGYISADLASGDMIATSAQALAGVANDVVMTPLRTKQLIDSIIADFAPDPDNPQEFVIPIPANTFINYRIPVGPSGYVTGQQYPSPTLDYLKYAEVELTGDQGNGVKLEFQVEWSNWNTSGPSPVLEYQIKKIPNGGSESIVASGLLAPTSTGSSSAPLQINDTPVYRSRPDFAVVIMLPAANSGIPNGKSKYVLEIKRSATGTGTSYIYYTWITATHINYTSTYTVNDFRTNYNAP